MHNIREFQVAAIVIGSIVFVILLAFFSFLGYTKLKAPNKGNFKMSVPQSKQLVSLLRYLQRKEKRLKKKRNESVVSNKIEIQTPQNNTTPPTTVNIEGEAQITEIYKNNMISS